MKYEFTDAFEGIITSGDLFYIGADTNCILMKVKDSYVEKCLYNCVFVKSGQLHYFEDWERAHKVDYKLNIKIL